MTGTREQDGEALPTGARICTVGDDGHVADAVTSHGGVPTEELGNSALVVTVGRQATVEVAVSESPVPILPVASEPVFRSVDAGSAPDAIACLFDGDWTTIEHPIVSVRGTGEYRRSVIDVALVVGEPGRISEFGVRSRGDHHGSIRADGVVVALPAGSRDYARAVGGPIVAPETDVAAIVPIAPYAVDPDHWVVSLANLTVSLERAETPVELVIDGESVGHVDVDDPVVLERTGTFRSVVVPGGRRAGLETP